MKKVVFLLLVIVLLVLPVAAYAGKPHENVTAYFHYVPAMDCVDSWSSNNYFGRNCTDAGRYGYISYDLNEEETLGDFVGYSTEVYDLVLHGADPDGPFPFYAYEKKGFYKGIVTFVGTVGDSDEGTMDIMYIGKTPPGVWSWTGTWRILGGEEGLEGIHGGGTWMGAGADAPNFNVRLDGKVHFN